MNDERISFSGLGGCRFAMATNGLHKYGILDNTVPHLCLIYGEEGFNWIGRWVTTYVEFFDVKFPKNTTTILTDLERDKYKYIIEGALGKKLLEKHTIDSKRI